MTNDDEGTEDAEQPGPSRRGRHRDGLATGRKLDLSNDVDDLIDCDSD